LTLLDLRMPGLSGEATFERLRELEPSLPSRAEPRRGAEDSETQAELT
jgi:CheY-like chemotaxis protein